MTGARARGRSKRRPRGTADGDPAARNGAVAGAASGDAGPVGAVSGASATQERTGTLFVVATPIGNLADITLRALDVLRSVDLVAAEDTRTTRVLFTRHAIGTALTSYHARNAARRGAELIARLERGEDVALVTDAGTPAISDPGAELVEAWGVAGGRVVPVPGASAVLAAVSATALAGPRWSFEGFLPRSGSERRARLDRVARDERGTVIFEAANRVAATLRDLAAACGGERRAALCRELTKLHEEVVRGTLGSLGEAAAADRITLRGEVVIVVGEAERGAVVGRRADTDPATARAEVDRLVAGGLARGEAARRISRETGIARRDLYGVRPSSGDGERA